MLHAYIRRFDVADTVGNFLSQSYNTAGVKSATSSSSKWADVYALGKKGKRNAAINMHVYYQHLYMQDYVDKFPGG